MMNGLITKKAFFWLIEVDIYSIKRGVFIVLQLHSTEFWFAFTVLIPYAGELRPSVIWAVAAEGHPIEEGFGARIGCAGAIRVVGAVSKFALDALSHRISTDTLPVERIYNMYPFYFIEKMPIFEPEI